MKKFIISILSVVLIAGMTLPKCSIAAGHSEYYNDVPGWATEYVDYCYENGMMYGSGVKTFSPNGSVTLAELCTILYRLAGEPESCKNSEFDFRFYGNVRNDIIRIGEEHWSFTPLSWAADNNFYDIPDRLGFQVNTGESFSRVNGANYVTRDDIIQKLYALAVDNGVKISEPTADDFVKISAYTDISEYYCAHYDNLTIASRTAFFKLDTGEKFTENTVPTEYLQNSVSEYWIAAVRDGVINGRENGKLAIKDRLTRAELATILTRFYKVYGSYFK